jgi:cytochrome c556
MTKRLLGAMVLAVGLLVGVVGAADDKSKSSIPTISDVMRKVNGKAGLQKAVGKALTSDMIDWDDVQKKTKEMLEHVEALGKNTPEKGTKESWEKLTKSWLDSAKKVDEAAKKKDKEATTKALTVLQGACRTCHSAHKGA